MICLSFNHASAVHGHGYDAEPSDLIEPCVTGEKWLQLVSTRPLQPLLLPDATAVASPLAERARLPRADWPATERVGGGSGLGFPVSPPTARAGVTRRERLRGGVAAHPRPQLRASCLQPGLLLTRQQVDFNAFCAIFILRNSVFSAIRAINKTTCIFSSIYALF